MDVMYIENVIKEFIEDNNDELLGQIASIDNLLRIQDKFDVCLKAYEEHGIMLITDNNEEIHSVRCMYKSDAGDGIVVHFEVKTKKLFIAEVEKKSDKRIAEQLSLPFRSKSI